jgi:hypothetical protein
MAAATKARKKPRSASLRVLTNHRVWTSGLPVSPGLMPPKRTKTKKARKQTKYASGSDLAQAFLVIARGLACGAGHDLREVKRGKVHGRAWRKTQHDPGTLFRCKRCSHQVFTVE